MYFYNKSSSRKIIHLDNCHHITGSKKQSFGEFYTLEEALRHGYRPCRHCFTVSRRFLNEEERIAKYCNRYNYTFSCENDCVEIKTGKGQWKIIQLPHSQRTALYHKNTEIRSSDCFSKIEGYHYQNVNEYELVDYIHYIVRHDGGNHKPAKGTKKYKNIQKKMAKQAKRRSVNTVLYLIDNLHINYAV